MISASQYTSIALAFIFLVAACSDGDEHALFENQSGSELPECMADQFPFEAAFLAAKTYNDRTGLYLQTSSDHRSNNDGIVVELYEPGAISIGEPVELGAASVPAPAARGKMIFFSSCPYGHDTLKLRGTLRFDSFETHADGLIAGVLEDGSAINARSGETKIEDLSGTWSFRVRKGPPYEDFYAIPERP